jgi:flagellar basal body P-ring protein FlgI
MKDRKFINIILALILTLCGYIAASAEVSVKIKDLTKIDGLKENQVFGYGLIVGLPGTGDSRSGLARASLENFLKNLAWSRKPSGPGTWPRCFLQPRFPLL